MLADVFLRFLRLGLTSFGGPVAHLGYFRREFVERAGWLRDEEFSEIVALCSVLPGPTSSQVGMLLGALRAGPAGSVAAWLAFTTPSAAALTLFAIALHRGDSAAAGTAWSSGALEGLTAAAAAVVAFAVVSMAKTLAATVPSAAIAAGAFVLALIVHRISPALGWIPLAAGGLAGAFAIRDGVKIPPSDLALRVPRAVSWIAFGVLSGGLLLLPAFSHGSNAAALFSTFFRAGSLVFGGGHVVLAFLEGLIAAGTISSREFFAGYGAAQLVPGPLFTFAAFLGAAGRLPPNGVPGAIIATLGIFIPSFLLLAAAIPLWSSLRRLPLAPRVLAGVNASVVGLLAAVFVDPIARTILVSPPAVAIAAAAYAGLALSRLPAWAVVGLAASAGALAGGAGLH